MEEKRSLPLIKPDTDLPALPIAAGRSVSSVKSASSFSSKLWRGKWILLFSVLAFTLIALMLGAVHTPLYRAQTSVELQGAGTLYPRASSENGAVSDQTESFIQTQIRIIQSRSLLERILARLSDEERSRIVESPRFAWGRRSYDQTVESLLQHLSAQPSAQAGIVDISFLSPDPVAGAHFLNTLTQELSDYNVERSWHAAQRNREWTDRQLDELRRKWEQSELILAEYSQLSGIGVAAPAAAKTPLSRPATNSNSSEANDGKLRELKSHLADLDKQVAQWQALYGPSSSQVSALKSQATETETSIRLRRAELQRASSPAASQPAAVKDPPLVSARPQPRAVAVNPTQVITHFNVLKQDADSNRQIYETAAAKLKEVNVANAAHVGDINVVDPAIAAAKPASPGQLMNGFLGAIAGLLVGLAFVTLQDHFSHTFAEPSLLSQQLALNVLGVIPVDRLGASPNGFARVPDGISLHLTFDRDAQTAECYRSIRSSILLGANQHSGPRRLVFTSAGASDGKTMVVGNLGAALASAQRRVLLVDGDLRNPGLHKLFGTDNERGLVDLLSHQLAVPPVATRDVIRETQIPDLYLLSAGDAGARAPEILSSIHLPQLIREFAKGFDIVLIDSPPVLPYADARSLARASDAVILVVKAGSTDRRSALLARDAIAQDGTPVAGVILTDWDRSRAASA